MEVKNGEYELFIVRMKQNHKLQVFDEPRCQLCKTQMALDYNEDDYKVICVVKG